MLSEHVRHKYFQDFVERKRFCFLTLNLILFELIKTFYNIEDI